MKIDPQIPAAENQGTNRVTGSQSGQAKISLSGAANEPNDTVHLSANQATVRHLVSQLNQVPDIREQQVSALQSQIQSGTYSRSNEQVAGAIVDQLFGAGTKG